MRIHSRGAVLFFSKVGYEDLLEFLEQVIGLRQQALIQHGEEKEPLLVLFQQSEEPQEGRESLLELLQEYYKFVAIAGELVDDVTASLLQGVVDLE